MLIANLFCFTVIQTLSWHHHPIRYMAFEINTMWNKCLLSPISLSLCCLSDFFGFKTYNFHRPIPFLHIFLSFFLPAIYKFHDTTADHAREEFDLHEMKVQAIQFYCSKLPIAVLKLWFERIENCVFEASWHKRKSRKTISRHFSLSSLSLTFWFHAQSWVSTFITCYRLIVNWVKTIKILSTSRFVSKKNLWSLNLRLKCRLITYQSCESLQTLAYISYQTDSSTRTDWKFTRLSHVEPLEKAAAADWYERSE